MYCIITALYIPILSGAVLIFTGLRIRATLRNRRGVQIRLQQNTSSTLNTVDRQQTAAVRAVSRRCYTTGSRRTLKIITFTSFAYFACWSPYSVITLTQILVSSFKPPAGVEFAIMWLANANSAVNVFIYSATNKQFRRECVLLASRLCCSRWPRPTASEHQIHDRHGNVSTSLPAINLSSINVGLHVTATADTNLPDTDVPSSADNGDGGGVQRLSVPQCHFDAMKQTLSIKTLHSDEDDHFML